MDLEGFVRKRILAGRNKQETASELVGVIGEYKGWDARRKEEFANAVYEEVYNSLRYLDLDDDFLKRVLTYPRADVSMGVFGVGSRGSGDLAVHRDIAKIIGDAGAVIGPLEQDDAGVVKADGCYVTIAVDGIHSRLSEFPFLAGFHASRAAMRDVYAMGSKPVALVSDIHLADDGDVGRIYDYVAGISTVAELTHVPLVSGSTLRVGGDMVFGERLVGGVGAVGVSDNRPLARKDAMAGDVIMLTLGRGGGTVSTAAIYNLYFDVVKETLNVDFMKAADALLDHGLFERIHAVTDVTNGGLRGDAWEVSQASSTKLVFSEEAVIKSVSKPVYDMLRELGIDHLGVSTDSLLLILPEGDVPWVRKCLDKVTPVRVVGRVEKGSGAFIEKKGGVSSELVPRFRESAYTKVKGVIGELAPEDVQSLEDGVHRAMLESRKKKEDLVRWIKAQRP